MRHPYVVLVIGMVLSAPIASAGSQTTVAPEGVALPGRKILPLEQRIVSWEQMRAAHLQREHVGPPLSHDIPLHTDPLEVESITQSSVLSPRISMGGGTSAPTLGLRFKAADYPDANDRPPDTMGAIGTDHFMEVINGNVSIFDKATGYRLSSVSLLDFFAEVHTEDIPFDPRVLFDQHSGRWVAMAADCRCDPNTIVFGVSLTDDPTREWFLGSFPAGGFADYPTLGVDADGIYIAANVAEKVWAIDKAPLLQDPPSVGTITEWTVFVDALQPAHTYGTPGSQYFIDTATSTSLRVYELVGPLTSPTLTNLGTLVVPPYANPPNAPALGSREPISVGNGAGKRLQMAVHRDGSLWTCHTIARGGLCACRWYELDPANLTLLQSGTVGDQSLHYYYPSIMVNSTGDAAMGFSGSDASQFVATYFTGRLSTDSPGAMAGPVLLKEGEASYTALDSYGRNRWGDYSYTTLDPVDQLSFWTIQEYASSPEDTWGTWVGQLSFEGFDCNRNDIQDADDIAGNSADCDANGVPDECQADCNDNGVADTCDITGGDSNDADSNGIPDECEHCPADLDGDGEVGILDLLTLLADWGACPGCSSDIDGDGDVAILDLLALLAAWGPC